MVSTGLCVARTKVRVTWTVEDSAVAEEDWDEDVSPPLSGFTGEVRKLCDDVAET